MLRCTWNILVMHHPLSRTLRHVALSPIRGGRIYPNASYPSRGGPTCSEVDLLAPRRAYLSRGGSIRPEAGPSGGERKKIRLVYAFRTVGCSCPSTLMLMARDFS